MIDGKYIIRPDAKKQIELKTRLDKHGFEECFKSNYFWLDCTVIVDTKRGWRRNQTINDFYKCQLGELYYWLSLYEGTDKEQYLRLMEERHNNNLEFEKLNPPIDFDELDDKYVRRKNKPKHKEVDGKRIAQERAEKVEKIKKGFKFLVNGPIV